MTIGTGIHEKILIGSSYFFNKFEDYDSHDIDYLVLVDNPSMFKDTLQIRGVKANKEDIMYWRNMSKQEFIKLTLKRNFPMEAGKFLIPEFCKKINLSIDDLQQFEELFNNIDDKHKYEKIIYDSYVENKCFKLNDDQLSNAYNEYKKHRTK